MPRKQTYRIKGAEIKTKHGEELFNGITVEKSPDSKGRNGYPNTQQALRNLNRKRAENLSLPNHSKDVKDTKSETILEAVKEGAGEKTQWPGEIAL